MSATVKRGRQLVLAVIIANLVISLGVMSAFVVLRGTDRLHLQLFRLFLTIIIVVFLYRGVPAARALAVILYVIGAITTLSGDDASVMALGALYACMAGVLVFSPSVSMYFRQRAHVLSKSART